MGPFGGLLLLFVANCLISRITACLLLCWGGGTKQSDEPLSDSGLLTLFLCKHPLCVDVRCCLYVLFVLLYHYHIRLLIHIRFLTKIGVEDAVVEVEGEICFGCLQGVRRCVPRRKSGARTCCCCLFALGAKGVVSVSRFRVGACECFGIRSGTRKK